MNQTPPGARSRNMSCVSLKLWLKATSMLHRGTQAMPPRRRLEGGRWMPLAASMHQTRST
jgi:hypothetical protein